MHRRKPLLLPPRCHCLSRGSSGRAGVVACGGGSGSSSSGGSGTILFLVCCHNPPPLCLSSACRHRPSPFRCSLLSPQAVAHLPSTCNGWLLFAPKSIRCGGAVAPTFARRTTLLPPLPHLAPSNIRAASCAAAGGGGPRGASPDDIRDRAGDLGDDSIALLVSVRDMDDDDDNVNDSGGGMGRKISVFLVLIFVGDMLSRVSVVFSIVGIITPLCCCVVTLSRRCVVVSSSSLSPVLTTFTAAIALATVIAVAVVIVADAAAAALR